MDRQAYSVAGPLGVLYPDSLYITEGGTPYWLGLVPNGLAWSWTPDAADGRPL